MIDPKFTEQIARWIDSEHSSREQIEAGAQLGCAGMLSQPENKGMLGFFMSIDSAEFLRPVLPGERLDIKITYEPHGRFGVANGEFYVGETKVAVGTIKFALVPKETAQ